MSVEKVNELISKTEALAAKVDHLCTIVDSMPSVQGPINKTKGEPEMHDAATSSSKATTAGGDLKGDQQEILQEQESKTSKQKTNYRDSISVEARLARYMKETWVSLEEDRDNAPVTLAPRHEAALRLLLKSSFKRHAVLTRRLNDFIAFRRRPSPPTDSEPEYLKRFDSEMFVSYLNSLNDDRSVTAERIAGLISTLLRATPAPMASGNSEDDAPAAARDSKDSEQVADAPQSKDAAECERSSDSDSSFEEPRGAIADASE